MRRPETKSVPSEMSKGSYRIRHELQEAIVYLPMLVV